MENISVSVEEFVVPEFVFIVPYRDRLEHYNIFTQHMDMYLKKYYLSSRYNIFFIHQKDERGFNRGALKNIGFLLVKRLYPKYYKNITLVFNDIDSMPSEDTYLPYKTSCGTIKHFYGFTYTLGGIVSVTAGDFELMNGFPNFWAWGYEDNLLQMRANKNNISIDRSVFFPINDQHIIRLMEPSTRIVNVKEFNRYFKQTTEGIQSIRDLVFDDPDEKGFVNVLQFNTQINEDLTTRNVYDLKNGSTPFKSLAPLPKRKATMSMIFG
jgi:hypothetical protein